MWFCVDVHMSPFDFVGFSNFKAETPLLKAL